jgi:mRNA interferase MazF
MKRGEIWVAKLNPSQGAEVGKVRPVLVIQADELTEAGADTVVILPLTTQVRPGLRLYRVTVPARDRILRDCQVIIEKPRSLDRRRFGEDPLSTLTATEMASVERGLLAVLGMASYLPDNP